MRSTVGNRPSAGNLASLGPASGFSLGFPGGNARGGAVAPALRMCDDSHMGWTVLVVDDHPAFRASARRLLELHGFRVVGEAGDAESALRLTRALRPQLALLDIGLPDRSGFDVAEQLAGGQTRVILISSRAQADLGRRVRESGALGFISKENLSGETLLALLKPA